MDSGTRAPLPRHPARRWLLLPVGLLLLAAGVVVLMLPEPGFWEGTGTPWLVRLRWSVPQLLFPLGAVLVGVGLVGRLLEQHERWRRGELDDVDASAPGGTDPGSAWLGDYGHRD